jgi:hypothetical protein
LVGQVAEQSRLGPPGYGENPDTDLVVVIFVMLLERPLCVQNGGSFPDIPSIRTIQIAGDLGMKRARDLIARKSVSTGRLYEAHSGYHYTPVLIEISARRAGDNLGPSQR